MHQQMTEDVERSFQIRVDQNAAERSSAEQGPESCCSQGSEGGRICKNSLTCEYLCLLSDILPVDARGPPESVDPVLLHNAIMNVRPGDVGDRTALVLKEIKTIKIHLGGDRGLRSIHCRCLEKAAAPATPQVRHRAKGIGGCCSCGCES